MMMTKSFSFASVLLSSLVSLSSFAQASDAVPTAAEALSYQAFIGNHDSVTVTALDTRLKVVNNRSSSQTIYTLVWADESIELKSGDAHLVLKPSAEDYVETLIKIRDLVAYTSIPQRFSWGPQGASSLNLDLKKTSDKIDALLSKYRDFESNCIVYAENGNSQLAVSVGIFGDLGFMSHQLRQAWVKAGYELVLVPAPNLSLDQGLPSLFSQSEGGDANFDLGEAGARVASMACRPLYF